MSLLHVVWSLVTQWIPGLPKWASPEAIVVSSNGTDQVLPRAFSHVSDVRHASEHTTGKTA